MEHLPCRPWQSPALKVGAGSLIFGQGDSTRDFYSNSKAGSISCISPTRRDVQDTLQVWRSIAPLSRRIIHRLTSRMLIVAVLSARELTVALQYRLAADTMYMYIYGATLVRIDSRQTRIKKHIVSFLFPFPFFFFTSSVYRSARSLTLQAMTGSRGNSRPSNSYHRVLTKSV